MNYKKNINHIFSMKNKTVVIFGGTGKLGLSFSNTLSKAGARIYLLDQKKKKIIYKVDKNRIRPIDADLQVPDTTKFKLHTGWEPKYRFEKTMSDLLDYWREKVKNKKFYLNR